MASQIRKPLVIIIVTIIIAVIIIFNSGVFSDDAISEGLSIVSASLESDTILIDQNTTLLVEIKNTASKSKTFELWITYFDEHFLFFDYFTKAQLKDITINPSNYTLIHPDKGTIDINVTIAVIVKGPRTEAYRETFKIVLEVISLEDNDKYLADTKTVSLTVTH